MSNITRKSIGYRKVKACANCRYWRDHGIHGFIMQCEHPRASAAFHNFDDTNFDKVCKYHRTERKAK